MTRIAEHQMGEKQLEDIDDDFGILDDEELEMGLPSAEIASIIH